MPEKEQALCYFGDMQEFGKVYMSTVGCGIVYGALADSTKPPVTATTPAQTTKTTTSKTTAKTTETTSAKITTKIMADPDIVWGDATCDASVDVSDCVLISKFAVEYKSVKITDAGLRNSDVTHDGNVTSDDVSLILQYIARIIPASGLEPKA